MNRPMGEEEQVKRILLQYVCSQCLYYESKELKRPCWDCRKNSGFKKKKKEKKQ